MRSDLRLSLPTWVAGVIAPSRRFGTADAKVRLAIELSRRNVEERTGGPFGAAIFGPDDTVVAVGVNAVLPLTCSAAHAEMLAFMLAQQHVGRPRLNRNSEGQPLGPYALATSSQPCCQCYGAAVWAGIDRLLIGARTEDVQALSTRARCPTTGRVSWRRAASRSCVTSVARKRATCCAPTRPQAVQNTERWQGPAHGGSDGSPDSTLDCSRRHAHGRGGLRCRHV